MIHEGQSESSPAAQKMPEISTNSSASLIQPPTPPPQVKAVIDKLVEFVAKSGAKFEQVVREKEKNNDKFAFLHPWNQYNPYYQWALAKVPRII